MVSLRTSKYNIKSGKYVLSGKKEEKHEETSQFWTY